MTCNMPVIPHGSPSDTRSTRHDRYRYCPLSKDEIRLIELFPGKFDEPLRCHLLTSNLSTSLHYEALSYVWGDPQRSKSIHTRNGTVSITPSLSVALRYLRYRDRKRVLFADGICINQDDENGEKAAQVALMAKTYRFASNVIVWLGTDDGVKVSLACREMAGYARYARGRWTKVSDSSPFTVVPVEDWSSHRPLDEMLDAIIDIFQRPWFSRVWVLQEAAEAREAMLVCGASSMPFEDLICFADAACRNPSEWVHESNMVLVANCYAQVWAPWGTARTWMNRLPFAPQHLLGRDSSKLPIADLLRMALMRNTTDPRDRIFALLGHPALHLPNSQDLLIQPDYEVDLEEICRRTTVAAINKKRDLSLLSLVQHGPQNPRRLKQSWAPKLHIHSDIIDSFLYSAGSFAEADTSVNEALKLRCRGVAIGCASCPTEAFPSLDELKESDQAALNFMRIFKKIMEMRSLLAEGASRGDLSTTEYLASILTCFTPPQLEHGDLTGELANKVRLLKSFDHWQIAMRSSHRPNKSSVRRNSLITGRGLTQDDRDYYKDILFPCSNRRLFRLSNGLWGLGPGTMQNRDICCCLFGTRVPFILHPKEDTPGAFEFGGECYVPGLMFGEAKGLLERGDVEEQDFLLI